MRFDSTVTAAQARLIKYFGSGRTQPYAGGGLGEHMRIGGLVSMGASW